jgi:membrane-associated protein
LSEELVGLIPVVGDLLQSLESSGGLVAYGLLVLTLVLGACGVPFPEEAVFAIGGALAARGGLSWFIVYVLGWSVVLALDVALHAVGYRFGPGIERSKWGKKVGPDRWAAMQRFVARRGAWSVVAARFVMGARIPVFLLAGAMGMPRARFIAVAGAAGLFSAAAPLALGYAFGAHLDTLLEVLKTARWVILGSVLLLLLLWWATRRRA